MVDFSGCVDLEREEDQPSREGEEQPAEGGGWGGVRAWRRVLSPLPSGERVWERGSGKGFAQGTQHGIEIGHHVVVPEADDAIALSFDERGAPIVAACVTMRRAVEFDDQFAGAADEVRDVGADDDLAGELDPGEAFGAQGGPEFAFGLGHLAAHLAGAFE